MDEQINPPQVPPSANPAPTPQTPSGPHGSSVKKIVIGVVSIALVAGASAAALYYIPRNNTGITSPTPTPAPSPVPAAPTSTPSSCAAFTKRTQVYRLGDSLLASRSRLAKR
jgi:hypothetical protein